MVRLRLALTTRRRGNAVRLGDGDKLAVSAGETVGTRRVWEATQAGVELVAVSVDKVCDSGERAVHVVAGGLDVLVHVIELGDDSLQHSAVLLSASTNS